MVYDAVGYKPVDHSSEQGAEFEKKVDLLQDRMTAEKLSYANNKLPYLKEIQCMADNDNSVTVLPDGRLGKCENGSSEEAFASVFGDEYPENKNRCKVYDEYQMCFACQLYPYCLHLKICPENGNCNEVKAQWRKDRYGTLMNEIYLKKKQSTDNAKEDVYSTESDNCL